MAAIAEAWICADFDAVLRKGHFPHGIPDTTRSVALVVVLATAYHKRMLGISKVTGRYLLLLDSEFCVQELRIRLTNAPVRSALALPTLKTVLPKPGHGAVVLTDNTISGVEGYKDLLAFLRDPKNGFQNSTLPFTNGFEMSVYLPDRPN